MIIDSFGRVIDVRADKEAGMGPLFERCMIREFKTLSFPASEGGKTVEVTAVFMVKR